MIWNVNDWCFFEFKLCQIKEVNNGNPTMVTDGSFQTSGGSFSERCFALGIPIKNASDSVAYWSDKFHAAKINGLNHPDLHRELVRRWCEICENIDHKEKLESLYKDLDKFGRAILDRVQDLRYEEVAGVKLFR